MTRTTNTLNEMLPVSENHGRELAVNVQLIENRRDVVANRYGGDEELRRDRRRRHALRQKFQNLRFARRQNRRLVSREARWPDREWLRGRRVARQESLSGRLPFRSPFAKDVDDR